MQGPDGTWAAVVRADGRIEEWWGWYDSEAESAATLSARRRELLAEDGRGVRKLTFGIERRGDPGCGPDGPVRLI